MKNLKALNDRIYINNMGVKPLSDINQKTLKRFIKHNPLTVEGMSDRQVYNTFKDTLGFAATRLGVAMSNGGISLHSK